ncbi:MAG: PhoX family phosphatase [Candidatus Competibacteraceae bacterium]|jgi:secreted PhoX family phosphatase|nr:PhoX family phosphatase [Candidatus Competibacteraceae bacterium]
MNDDHNEPTSNTSGNRPFEDVLQVNLSRRQIMQGGLGVAVTSLFGLSLTSCGGDGDNDFVNLESTPSNSLLGFESIPTNAEDIHVVPPGYTAKAFFRWGDPVSDGPAFNMDASNPAADQMVQSGMHHDGMHYFSLPIGSDSSDSGLLVMNHEYIDPNLATTTGGYSADPDGYIKDKADKEMAAHGVSIIEVRKANGEMTIVRPSQFGRRVTMHTPMTISGPAAGSSWMITNDDPSGREVIGTMNNCAHGYTPWGTYLACEENFHGYFFTDEEGNQIDTTDNEFGRYGVGGDSRYGWEVHHPRFNADITPNEPNRFGWIVEIDPYDPNHKPVKRTAMGRFRHEGAAMTTTDDNRVVIYSGDDAVFEYVYKYVSNRPYDTTNRAANMMADGGILDDGILYVAKYNDDGTGEWIPLVHGTPGLTGSDGFEDQAELLVKTRLAADSVGATPMDRPEWIAVHPQTREVYVTLTNNSAREQTDAANPRPENRMGHIIRWRETGNDPAATTFQWDIYVLAGDPNNANPDFRGNINGDIFANPDGIWIDQDGRLWIQTDIGGSSQLRGDFEPFGNNQMLASDPSTGEVRRFFTGPRGQEITGVITTPDGRTMFINVQHPGDISGGLRDELGTSDTVPGVPPLTSSNWPDFDPLGRPRSATVIITKDDGGVIGT